MKVKKWLIVVLSAVMALALALGVAACGTEEPEYDHANDTFTWTANADGKTHTGTASCGDASHNKTENHTWGTDNKCIVCGAEKPQEQHQHTYDAWDYDDTQHWKYCDEHGSDKSFVDESTKADHDFSSGNCVCGKEKPADPPTPPTLKEGWYVMGQVASIPEVNWDTYVAQGYVEGNTITLTLTAADQFKFAKYVAADNADVVWTNGEIGFVSGNSNHTQYFTGAGLVGTDFKAKEAGQYTFVLDGDAKTVTVTKVEEQHNDTYTWTPNDDGLTHKGTASCGNPEHDILSEPHEWNDTECTKCHTPKPEDPKPTASVVLTYTTDSWVSTTDLTFTEDTEWQYDGQHFTLKHELPKDAEFYLHETYSNKDGAYYNYGDLQSGNDVFNSAEGGLGKPNFVVKETATYIFDFYYGTKTGDDVEPAHFDAKKEGEEPGPTPTLQAGWYVVGVVASLEKVNWEKFVQEGYAEGNTITLTLTTSDQFKFAKYNGAATDTVVWEVGEIGYTEGNSKYFNAAGDYKTDFQPKANGTYTFTLNESAKTATVTWDDEKPVDPDTQEDITVHYHKVNDWAKLGVYSFIKISTSSSTELLGKWPGVTTGIEDEGDGWYRYTFKVEKGHVGKDLYVIFNEGLENGSQTKDVLVTSAECWIAKDEKSYDSREAADQAEKALTTFTYTFYFYNSKGWTKILFHAWGAFATGGWNTVFMDPATEELGSGWYKYIHTAYEDLTGQQLNIIIGNANNNGNPRITIGDTGNTPLTLAATTYYFHGDKNQKAFTSKEEALGTTTVALEAMLPVYDLKSYLGA